MPLTTNYSLVEMNVGIIVACVSTFPICFANVKMYIHSATTSLRTLLVSSSGKETIPRTSQIAKDSFLQTHESLNNLNGVDPAPQYVELNDVAPHGQWTGQAK